MFSLRKLTVLLLLLGVNLGASGQQTVAPARPTVKATVTKVQTRYCRADTEVFTVSLKLKVEVKNSLNTTAQLLWPMTPWIGKVAQSRSDALAGHFLFEQTGSHYPQKPIRFERLEIGPGKKITVQTGYDLVARFNRSSSVPNSVTTGTYAVVIVLKPEEEPPPPLGTPETVQTISTEPFLVRVSNQPRLIDCDLSGRAKK